MENNEELGVCSSNSPPSNIPTDGMPFQLPFFFVSFNIIFDINQTNAKKRPGCTKTVVIYWYGMDIA